MSEIHTNDYIYDIWYLQEIKITENIQIHSIQNVIKNDICCPGQNEVTIAIKKSIQFDFLDLSYLQHQSIELIGIKISIPAQNTSLCIINLYRYLGSHSADGL